MGACFVVQATGVYVLTLGTLFYVSVFYVDIMSSHIHNSPFSNAPVAQLDRVPGYELGGREFESLRARHFPHFVGLQMDRLFPCSSVGRASDC